MPSILVQATRFRDARIETQEAKKRTEESCTALTSPTFISKNTIPWYYSQTQHGNSQDVD